MPSYKKKVEDVPDPLHPPKPIVQNIIAQFFLDGTWYDRERDGWWYVGDIMLPLDRRYEVERAWIAAGNVPPPRTEL